MEKALIINVGWIEKRENGEGKMCIKIFFFHHVFSFFFLWINSGIALHPHPARKSFYPSLAGLTFTASTSLKHSVSFFCRCSYLLNLTVIFSSHSAPSGSIPRLPQEGMFGGNVSAGIGFTVPDTAEVLLSNVHQKPQCSANYTCSCVSVCFQEKSWKSCTRSDTANFSLACYK